MIIAFSHANNVEIAVVDQEFGIEVRKFIEKTRKPFYFDNYNGSVVEISSSQLRKQTRFYPDSKLDEVNMYQGPNSSVINSFIDNLGTVVSGGNLERMYFEPA